VETLGYKGESMTYLFYLSIALDQLLNTVLGGFPDETISARCWREKRLSRYLIDALFFWQYVFEKSMYNNDPGVWKGHCEQCYEYEMKRMDLPEEYRK
jgi:hypothetical protein